MHSLDLIFLWLIIWFLYFGLSLENGCNLWCHFDDTQSLPPNSIDILFLVLILK